MLDKPDNELPDHEEKPLDAGDAGDAGFWPSGAFGDMEPEEHASGVWGSADANGEQNGGFIDGEPLIYRRLYTFKPDGTPDANGEVIPPGTLNESMNRWVKTYFEHSAVPPGLLSKKSHLWKRSDVYFFCVLWFLFGIIAGLFLAAFLDSRLPK